MQWANLTAPNEPAHRWKRDVVLVNPFGKHCGKRAPVAASADGVVTRVLSTTQLDPTMRQQLARVLRVTVHDWLQASASQKVK